MKKHTLWTIFSLLVVAVLLVACGGGEPAEEEPAEEPVAEEPMEEEPVEEEPIEEPVETEEPMEEEPMMDLSGTEVLFWHVWGSGSQAEQIDAIVADFNANNEYGITVVHQAQGGYSDTENAMNAAIQSGDVPALIVGYTNVLANWENAGVMLDLTDLAFGEDYGLSADEVAAMYPGTLAGGVTPTGAQIGWPVSQSINTIFYNVTWAQELGFDSAPTNYAEFKEQACAAAEANNTDDNAENDGTGGLVLYPSASNVSSWIFAAGGSMEAEDGSYNFNNDEVVGALTFLKDLQDSGCTITTPSYPNPEFAGRLALFAESSSAGTPFQEAAFADIGSEDVWTLIPHMGPEGGQAVNGFGQYIGVVNTTPEANVAAWLFLRYLTYPETQAEWNMASGYFPTQSTTEPLLADFVAGNEHTATGLSLAYLAQYEPARASWTSLRRAAQDAYFAALAADSADDIPGIMDELNATAAEIVAETEG